MCAGCGSVPYVEIRLNLVPCRISSCFLTKFGNYDRMEMMLCVRPTTIHLIQSNHIITSAGSWVGRGSLYDNLFASVKSEELLDSLNPKIGSITRARKKAPLQRR